MKLVRRRHTGAERQLAFALRRRGLRFSTHKIICNCTPDIIFDCERLAVFVDGDFWHGRLLLEEGRRAFLLSFRPHVRKFWVAKITRNADRDQRQTRILRRNGWGVLRLWEKDVMKNPSAVAAEVNYRLRRRRIEREKRLRDAA
jgi:DNA mismatch endonuclease (patch repair protein)